MRLTRAQLNEYIVGLGKKLWSIGADLRPGPPVLAHDVRRRVVDLRLMGLLPGTGATRPAELTVRERWVIAEGEWLRVGYLYELDDFEANRRRAWHWHDTEDFVRRLQVVVHEHCEEVLGAPTCGHYAGVPVENGYTGIDLLLAAWIAEDEPLGCDRLVCLDGRG
ncbi:MAG: hypothetical protein C0498_00260 [Anaerolinea sp.]|nr:hypothetical protein [Anaerolinea sp.]